MGGMSANQAFKTSPPQMQQPPQRPNPSMQGGQNNMYGGLVDLSNLGGSASSGMNFGSSLGGAGGMGSNP